MITLRVRQENMRNPEKVTFRRDFKANVEGDVFNIISSLEDTHPLPDGYQWSSEKL
ncbi:hypothetical protein LCGC14_2885760 [marine sediment metagenome]|uniref:Uncharacterized protein n=1 Tax=marine sediment metagenome TaxID=412755 RepID=A0A0F9APV1_9ZZZZ